MQRIAIIGSCEAGKSTLARSLGKKLDLPVIHLDAYYWQPRWQESNTQQWLEIQRELIKGDRWIVDGTYGGTMNIRLSAADTVIWLDFNRYLCLWRIFKRYLQYRGNTRPDMAASPERLNKEFIRYVWNFSPVHRSRISDRLAKCQDNTQIIMLQNPRQVLSLLQQID